jgi:hypothetical protein
MTPSDFGVTRLKVKDTGALNDRMFSVDYLENYSS